LVFLPLLSRWIAARGGLDPRRLARESAALIDGASPEHLRLDVDDHGFTLRHEGDTTLAPAAWATVYYACRLHAAIADVASRDGTVIGR
jgi:hypothetical protein